MPNRHYARNISANFPRTRLAIRNQLADGTSDRSENRRWKVEHDQLITGLIGVTATAEVWEDVDHNLREIEVTYLTLLLTLDQSIRVKPIHDEIEMALRRIKSSALSLADEQRDKIVRITWDLLDDAPIPSTFDAFQACETIAQRAAVARAMMLRVSEEFEEVERFFDYKRGLSGPGAPAKYATVYLVFALADLFERVGWKQRRAYIVNGPYRGAGRVDGEHDQTDFETFIFEFMLHVDKAALLSQPIGRSREQLRSLTERVHRKPDLHRILDGDPDTETIIEFVTEADKIKS